MLSACTVYYTVICTCGTSLSILVWFQMSRSLLASKFFFQQIRKGPELRSPMALHPAGKPPSQPGALVSGIKNDANVFPVPGPEMRRQKRCHKNRLHRP